MSESRSEAPAEYRGEFSDEMDTLPVEPSKIIAVHLSYTSRAEQRGRQPKHPSYFFKPASSLASTGAEVSRPTGTELLAYEGEIALVIGRAASRVSIESAWDYVGFVTAANDWGVYDLRALDKGSNVRSKGRDGYTPVGPHLIGARTVSPDELRVRTWCNGTLVQDDTSAGMFFSLAQIVADLSQHFTLNPGDVILTGTPAGSSVAQPGDVVEVEVDAPNAPGNPTSGRLVSYVTEGDAGEFDAEIGALPAVDDTQRAEAWGSREAAGLPAEEAASPSQSASSALTPQLRAKLEQAPVAALSGQLRKRGLNNVTIDGVSPMHPEAKMVGVARTLRFVPNREDLFKSHGGGYNAQKQAFDALQEGEIIVIEARGEAGSGTLGDILAIRAKAQNAAGIVTDGGVRDYDAVAAVGLPVWCKNAHPAVLGRKHVPWEHGVAVGCGGTTVLPGDILVGDRDGVIVIPADIAEEVVDAALAGEAADAWIAQKVAEGHPIEGLFPMNELWRSRYEQETRKYDDQS